MWNDPRMNRFSDSNVSGVKIFRNRMNLTGSIKKKIVYIINSCSASHQVSFYSLIKLSIKAFDTIGNIGFLGQIRQMSSQFHFRAFVLKLFCLSSRYCVSTSEFGHSISFLVKSNSFSTLFNLAYRHSFSWHTRLKKRLRIWMLLWWIVKLNDYFVKSNDATLHLTNHNTKSNDPFL